MRNITTFNFNDLAQFKRIYVLISGGIDSTYLYEIINSLFPDKTYCVNCWNPYESSKTLKTFQKLSNFIEIRPSKKMDYKKVLIDAFEKIPQAIQARKQGKYHKKIFHCCYYMKHSAFKKDPLFQKKDSVVISGIKRGDGTQRRIWLSQMKNKDKFYHRHKEGQLYCYPFRDYDESELSDKIIKNLRKKYPALKHSGCSLCPVLVVFQDKIKNEPRVIESVKFYHKIINQKTIMDFLK